MRALIIAGAILTLTGCGSNGQADNSSNIGESLTAENIASNDVTAIDAVTDDAANMAADVNYTAELDNGLDNTLDNAVRAAGRKAPTRPSPTPPTVNTTTNVAANATQ